ncbi:MAG: pilus assembly protein TadG-related protein [Candidatus Cybelea sp.]
MRRAAESGQVLPLIALCLAALMGFGAIGVDVGYLEYRDQTQQAATDAAAAGGAATLVKAGCPNQTAATTGADTDAANNGFANAGKVSVTVINPPGNGPFANNSCAVKVTISTSNVATFFARLFGYPAGVTETTQATAIVSNSGAGCIYLLSPTAQSNFNGGHLTATKCGALINDTANFNGATVDALSIGYAGPAPNVNGATFQLGQPQPMMPVADPCLEIAGCNYLANNPPSTASCHDFNGNGYHGALTQGCYNNLNLNGAVVTMQGSYTFNGSENFNGASMTGNGVTIYVTANASAPNFNGTTQATMTPMTSGPTAGVLYYQVPGNSGSPNFNGTNANYSGLIYAPTPTSVNFNGASGGYLVLVFGAANFNGSVSQDFATPPPSQALIKQAVVAE